MKLRGIELIVAAVFVTLISATPISRIKRQNVIGTCLQIAPGLRPCNFDAEATWRSTSGEISHGSPAGPGYPPGTVEEFLPDGSQPEKILPGGPESQEDGARMYPGQTDREEFDLYENDLDITVVYYLEGCLPSRLPFDLPSCPIEELQAIQMNKLVPFKLPDVEDALIFPEIDLEQIEFSHRQSGASSAGPSSHENQDSLLRSRNVQAPQKAPPVGFGADDVNGKKKGLQDLNNTMLKRSMKPRTGMASTKYVNMLPAAGPTAMAPRVSGAKTKDGSVIRGVDDKNEPKSIVEGISNSDIIGILHRDGDVEIGDIFAKDKNRVQ